MSPEKTPGKVTYPKLYHATRPENVNKIRQTGFHGKSRSETSGGSDYGGAVFGAGTYFHTDKSHADAYLKGMHAYESGDEVQIQARAEVSNPLVVPVRAGEGYEKPDFEKKLREVGALKTGESYNDSKFDRKPGDVGAAEVTKRLQALGYDAVDVRQPKFDAYAGGSQLVVFDPSKVKYGH